MGNGSGVFLCVYVCICVCQHVSLSVWESSCIFVLNSVCGCVWVFV